MSRTPSKEAHEKVLNAAVELISQRGVENTSMDAIAAESGVSKATVYKHWPGKDALLLDVVQQYSARDPEIETADPKADLIEYLRQMAQHRKPEQLIRIWPMIIGYAFGKPDFGEALRQKAFDPRRQRIQKLLERAVKKGILRRGINYDFALAMLLGPIMHWRFADARHVPDDLAERVVDYFWKVFGAATSGPSRESARPPASGSRKSSHS